MDRVSLIKTYAEYDDSTLLSIVQQPADYSDVAVSVAREIIESRGGLDQIIQNIELVQARDAEIQRVKEETRTILTPGVDVSFVQKVVTSAILSKQQVENLVEAEWIDWDRDRKDREVNTTTIARGIPAVIIAGGVAGSLWGLSMMWSGRVFYIFLVGVVLLCYGIVKLFTRQSYKNSAVFILTILASIVAFGVGQLMWEYFGRQ